MGEEAHGSKAVVERDDDNTMRRQDGAVVGGFCPTADPVAATVQPNHDRQMRARLQLRCPYVEVQAILRWIERLTAECDAVGCCEWLNEVVGARNVLHAWMGRPGRVAHPRPGGNRLRLAPSQSPYWRRRERDTFKYRDIAPQRSLERAAGQMNERSFGRHLLRLFSRCEEHWNGKTKMKKPHKESLSCGFEPGLSWWPWRLFICRVDDQRCLKESTVANQSRIPSALSRASRTQLKALDRRALEPARLRPDASLGPHERHNGWVCLHNHGNS